MSLNDYLLENEEILAILSFRGGELTIAATNRRVFQYKVGEEGEEIFLDLPYQTITSVGTSFERISYYSSGRVAVLGVILIVADLILYYVGPALHGVFYWILAIVGVILILLGLPSEEETRSSLEFLGKDIPEAKERWTFPLAEMHGDQEDLAKLTKTIREQVGKLKE